MKPDCRHENITDEETRGEHVHREPIERELRVLIEAGATVDVNKNNQTFRATTVNMSGSGVLLCFESPVELAVGDQVVGEFRLADEADDSLPYWAVGSVVRVESCRAAIIFKGGGYSRLDSETGVAMPV